MNLLLQLERSPGDAQVAGAQARVRAGCGPCSTPTATSGARPWRAGRSPASRPTSSARGPVPRSSPREQAEREARLAEETERLKRHYGTTDAQQALARHAADADAELARIDKATKVPPTPFVKSPPMTLDDELQFESVRLANGVPLVASRFDSMTGAMTGLALRLDGVPRGRAALPVAAARRCSPAPA